MLMSGTETWEGVLLLLLVTLISLGADWIRRMLPPPRDPERYDRETTDEGDDE